MNDRATLLANVLNDPTDDTARLVLADWLEEHDEEALGRFVRAGVVAARFRDEELIDAPDYYAALDTISKIVTSGEPARWLAAVGVSPSPLTNSDWVWDNTGDRVTVRIGVTAGVFTRGLLSELALPLADWYQHAPRALASWPVERATITDVEGLSFQIEPPTADAPGWRLSGVIARRPPSRRRWLRGRLDAMLGTPVQPVLPSGRWSADFPPFPDRDELVKTAGTVGAILFAELRAVAGAQWPAPPRGS